MIEIWALVGLLLFLYMIEENRFVYHVVPSEIPIDEWGRMVFLSVIWPAITLFIIADRLIWIPKFLNGILTKEIMPWMSKPDES